MGKDLVLCGVVLRWLCCVVLFNSETLGMCVCLISDCGLPFLMRVYHAPLPPPPRTHTLTLALTLTVTLTLILTPNRV